LKFIQDRVGGVNLRADQADIQIQQDVNGFKFPPIDPAMLNLPMNNLQPVILRISPITIQDVGIKLGLVIPPDDSSDDAYSLDKAKETEELSVL